MSARAARGLDPDMPPLLAAFEAAGARAEIADWDDASVDWRRFDLALLRSAWDYTERLPQFLAWVERTAAHTRLRNPPAVVRWNCDKHYLRELIAAELPVVPTQFVEPDEEPAGALQAFLAHHGDAELVVKPTVGAGSRDTRRHSRNAVSDILAHMRPLLARGRSVMLQPYLEAVDRDGETALIFIGGRFSHAARKGPLLPRGAAATQALFAPEEISARDASPDELRVGEQLLRQLPFDPLLYARVDLIRTGSGRPCLLELELTEPSLFFPQASGSAARYVAAALALLSSSS